MALLPYIEAGYTGATLLADGNELERGGELHRRRCRMYTDSELSYAEGQAMPDFPGFYISRIVTTRDGPKYEHQLEGVGLLGVVEKRITGYPKPTYGLSDWDKVEDKWITRNPNLIVEGQLGVFPFSGNAVCTSVTPEPVAGGLFYTVTASFSGILRAKPRQRTISVNGETVSGDNIVINLPGGWAVAQKGQVQLPKVVVKDTYITTSPAPTQLIPGPLTPPNPPTVRIYNATGANVTRHYPAGWRLSSLASEQIGDKGLYKNDWIYEFQNTTTP